MESGAEVKSKTFSDFSIAIFPFLKTSAPVRLGKHLFRSTNDREGLPPAQRAAITELSAMLFIRDNMRIDQAAYAIAPPMKSLRPDPMIIDLGKVRTIISYFYSSPNPIFGNIFLTPEDVSLAVVQPARVSTYLVSRIHGATRLGGKPEVHPDQSGNVAGYEGVYNTLSPLWLVSDSRLYGPKPQMTLNIAQDLAADLSNVSAPAQLLLDLLAKDPSPFGERIFTALDWYNSANSQDCRGDQALLNLSVAFETLLQLPMSEKTERLSDAISLLLGRTDRLKEWAVQFYNARSAVAHTGRATDWWFYAAGGLGKGGETHPFGNLLTFGRQVFQLCVSTVLLGADLADRAGLRDQFIANSERYTAISRRLGEASEGPAQRLQGVSQLVDELGKFRFVPSGNLTIDGIVSAVRLAATTLIETKYDGGEELNLGLGEMARTSRKDKDFTKLLALERLATLFKKSPPQSDEGAALVAASLVEHAWNDLFVSFYRLKHLEEAAAPS